MSYRWLVFGTLIAALAVTSFGMFLSPWIDLPDFASIKIAHDFGERLPSVMWVLALIGAVGTGWVMYRERARAFVPGPTALITAVVALAGVGSMLWEMRTIKSSMALDRFDQPLAVGVAPGAWLVVFGFGVAALAALSLVRLAASQVRDSKPAS
jgi:hypothetical protein